MRKHRKSFLEKFYKNNGGMSIVTVIVAIGMVLLMVNILLLTSTVNFKMRSMNVYSKDSFYSAEQVLDEIEVGLQQLVSDGLSQAYMEVLTKYDTSEMTSAEKNEEVKRRFYQYVEKKLAIVSGSTYKYIAMPQTLYESNDDAVSAGVTEGLYALIKPSTRYHMPADTSKEVEEAYGAFLRTFTNDTEEIGGNTYYTGEMLESDKDGIHLKNLVIYYKDPNGFVSTIKTDINLVYPEFTFASTEMPDVASYCLITDTGLLQTKAGARSAAVTTTITGNSYAYMVDTTGTYFDYQPDPKKPKEDNVHIVFDSFNVTNGGIKTYDQTQLWTGDIVAKSSDITLAGRTYVQDDLNLKGRDCNVKLTGYYYGFGNGDAARGSSAILVNGVDTSIDLENVKRLMLAGRAYISFEDEVDKAADGSVIKEKIMKDESHQNAINPSPLDVYMGESVAAKSDQLMYLVPPECIGVGISTVTGADGAVVETYSGSKYNKNPLTVTEYNDIAGDSNYTMIAENMNVAKLGTGDTAKLGYYLEGGNKVQKIVVRSSSGGDSLVYFYMKFADEEKANLFFTKYYGLNKDAVDRYMGKYIKAITLPTTGSLKLKINVAGHVVSDNSETAEIDPDTGKKKRVISGITTDLNDDDESIADHYADDFERYSTMLMGYATKLSDDYETLIESGEISRSGDNKAVFDNLIDAESLDEVVEGTHVYFSDGVSHKALLINQKNVDLVYNLTASDLSSCNLIIADCGLAIPSGVNSFEGTIIARGKIELPGNDMSFKANSKKVDECMFLMTDDGVYSVADVFKNSAELTSLSSLDGDVSSDVAIQDLVKFENWTKNVEIK